MEFVSVDVNKVVEEERVDLPEFKEVCDHSSKEWEVIHQLNAAHNSGKLTMFIDEMP